MVDRREFLAGVLSTTGLVAVPAGEQVVPLADARKLTATITFDEAQIREITDRVTATLMRDLKLARRIR